MTYTPIQMIGTQRSGSNLLRLMLNQLDTVIAPHPPHILKTFTPLLPSYGDLYEEDNFRQLIADVCRLVETNPVVWEQVQLDRDRVYERCDRHSLQDVFMTIYDQMAEANGATHWCCKSMANVKYASQMEASDRKPLYIHLVRDGRDVAASFKKVAVGEKHVYHLATYWQELQLLSKKLVEQVGSERAITVRYEDLVHTPADTLTVICDFLKVPYSPQVLNYFNSVESQHTAASGFMWQNVRKPIMANNTEKFKTLLSAQEIEWFERVAGQTLQDYGYACMTAASPQDFNADEIAAFDQDNARMKRETLRQGHLKIDLSKRQAQEDFVQTIKDRKSLVSEC